MKPTITDADIALAEFLWTSKARKERGCTCAAVDIGVGDLHEPGCGDPQPEDTAAIVAQARAEGRAEERAAVVAWLLERAEQEDRDADRAKSVEDFQSARWGRETCITAAEVIEQGAHVAPAKAGG